MTNLEFGNHQKELEIALQAVGLASKATSSIQKCLKKSGIEIKPDRSPVTIADYASQAIINKHIFQCLDSNQKIVAEEESGDLRKSYNSNLLKEVIDNVERVTDLSNVTEILEAIDSGDHDATAERYWTLDPIDGTKGFIRGQQYAISLALIEKGEVVLGVLGCPNLPTDKEQPFEHGDDEGGIYFAVKNQGSWTYRTTESTTKKNQLKISSRTKGHECRPCESVESSHSKLSYSERIFKAMAIAEPPCRLDSQCKYAVVARGQADIYLRIPTDYHYEEKIWDHAAGSIIAEEAGALITDIRGKPLNFRTGSTLKQNEGIACALPSVHNELIGVISNIL